MKFENDHVYNMAEAIRAARYSFSSEDASDTTEKGGVVEIGEKDKRLIKKLIKAGPSHRKFMRAILLTVDITAPRYWWTQFDAYKVGITAISKSTMHTLMKRPIAAEDFSMPFPESWIICMEVLRQKGDFAQLVAMLPQGYLQKRHVAMNYEVARNIVLQRRGHKLGEWKAFIEWARGLPQADIFFGDLT